MFYEYSPTYNKITGSHNPNEIKYIAVLKDDSVEVLGVKCTEKYRESGGPSEVKDRYHYKLSLPTVKYKSFMHKWFNKFYIEYEYIDERVSTEFIADTEEEALLIFFNIMSNPNKEFLAILEAREIYIDNNPDIFLSKMQNYKGMKMSHPPKLYGEDYSQVQTTSW